METIIKLHNHKTGIVSEIRLPRSKLAEETYQELVFQIAKTCAYRGLKVLIDEGGAK